MPGRALTKGGGTLTVALDRVTLNEEDAASLSLSAGHYIRIRVADTGPGIPPEILSRVFDPFFTTKAPDKGTGLGLSISRSIVEQMGGSIRMQSAPGEGTTVTILLPVEPEA